jgi:hypothetical protein
MMSNNIKRLLLPLIIIAFLGGCSGDEESEPVAPDTTPPTVVSTSPVDGDTWVPVGGAISVTFSEIMNLFTFNDSAFIVRNQSGAAIPSISIDDDDKRVIFTPQNRLAHDENFTVIIADSVKDLAGNPLDSNFTWSFTTEPDLIMPLAIGNLWEFRVDVYDTTSGTIDTSYLDTLKIVDDTIIQDERWYIDQDGLLYTNKSDGLWRMAASDQPYLFLKFPATTGQTYSGNPDLGELMEVINTAVQVNVPHGFHICYQYYSRNTDPVFNYRYSNKFNLGPIAIEKVTAVSLKLTERRGMRRYDIY